MAPKKSEKEGKKKEAQPPTEEWIHSKCSLNDLNRLVSEGLLQDKSFVNWRPSFRDPFPMENVDEIVTFYHFSERGLALPSCSFSVASFIITGLSSITSTQTPFATSQFLSTSVKPSLESNPTGTFSVFYSESNLNPPPRIHPLWGVPASNCDSRPATSTYHTNSPPTFPSGRIIGSISKTMPPNSQRNQIIHLLLGQSGTSRGDMDQVEELLDTIEAYKLMG
jgi:hypothetical protein